MGEITALAKKHHGAFRVIGAAGACTMTDKSAIQTAWQTFGARQSEISAPDADGAYGVCYGADADGNFIYLAGYPVPEGADVPEGLDAVGLPEGAYAVTTYSGHISGFPEAVERIWTQELKAAGLTPRAAPNFEFYGAAFDPYKMEGEVEIWIPVT